MKPWATQVMGLLLLPLAAHAGDDYAQQWPVHLSRADAGAYQVTLEAAVYRAAYWRDLRDVRVLDAHGKPVASVLQSGPEAVPTQMHRGDMAWFPLPVASVTSANDWRVMVQRSSNGDVLAVRTTATSPATSSTTAGAAWLVDLGKDSTRMRALLLHWGDAGQALDAGYRLEGSDDLRDWRVLDPQVRLVQLRNQGQELRSNRIALEAPPRYLRLLPVQANTTVPLSGVQAEWLDVIASNPWQWQTAQAISGPEKNGFNYHSEGRFPVQRVALQMPANSSVRWSVLSRDTDTASASHTTAKWTSRAFGWTAWQLQDAGKVQVSPPLDLHAVITDRDWRVQVESGDLPATAPVVRLGYQPARLVFLAQGTPPYVVVAGRAAAQIATDAVEPLLAALRARHGAQWVPATASLGAGRPRAGDAAYMPAVAPRDWKTLTLWAVLVLGALVVGGFALSLLRGKSNPAAQ